MPSAEVMSAYRCRVDVSDKATELPLWKIRGSVQQNPHMRAFWASTISFFLAFLGWFALAPLSLEVAESMQICEEQLFPPEQYPTRPAYVGFKNLDLDRYYCRYGQNAAATDCNPAPADPTGEALGPYDSSVLTRCVCTPGTQCSTVVSRAGLASVTASIFVRMIMGTLLERLGPVNVQAGLLVFGSIWVFASAGITSPTHFIIIRFLIGTVGGAFVTNQFWCSLMFAPNVVATANGTAAGWGNLGGGVAQLVMQLLLFQPIVNSGVSPDKAWRIAMMVPASLFLVCAAWIKMYCWDTPKARRFTTAETGKHEGASMWDYVLVLKDRHVWLMMFQYGACFGTELLMNNKLAMHFRIYFQFHAGDAAALASAFGLMNFVGRSLGGMVSDTLFARFGFRGRLWAQFVMLSLEAIFLFAFGCVTNSYPWYVALFAVISLSLFVQMAEGTSFGVVPFINPKQLAVVSALVASGGNLGAVIAGVNFYDLVDDGLSPFKLHAAYVMIWAFATFFYRWPDHGGLLCGPHKAHNEDEAAQKNGTMEDIQTHPAPAPSPVKPSPSEATSESTDIPEEELTPPEAV